MIGYCRASGQIWIHWLTLLYYRLRLREEVDTLQHLSRVATLASGSKENCHPNVLGYVDSWEENEALYIQTELCEKGNLARFLWEYGRVCPRLDEARVWKIFVDLSNVSGPKLYHLLFFFRYSLPNLFK